MWRRLRYLLFVGIATLVLLEAGVRVWGYADHYIYDPIYVPFDSSAEIPFVLRPNLSNARGRGLAVVDTDSLGLRARKSGLRYGPKQTNEIRLAIVGDSITFGEGVERTEDTFPEVVESLANERGPRGYRFEVFNFGVSAYSVKQMAATLEHRVPEIDPDVAWMAIIPDDLNVSRTGSIDRWGYTYNPERSGFIDKDSHVKRWLRGVHLVYVLRDLRFRLRERKAALDLGTPLPPSYRYIERFRDVSADRGISCAVVLLPSPADRSRYERLARRMEADGIPFHDLSAIYGQFRREEYVASKFDGHPSVAVHRKIGEELVARLLVETAVRERVDARAR